eukprot:1782544-Amphidinium_carterae.1
MDNLITKTSFRGGVPPEAMYRDESLYTAHVGDCRLVLARDNRETTSTKLKADDLTQDDAWV